MSFVDNMPAKSDVMLRHDMPDPEEMEFEAVAVATGQLEADHNDVALDSGSSDGEERDHLLEVGPKTSCSSPPH